MYCGARCLNLSSCLFFFNLTLSLDTLGLVHPRNIRPIGTPAHLALPAYVIMYATLRQLDLSIENLAIIATHKTSRWSSARACLICSPPHVQLPSSRPLPLPLLSHHFAALILLVSRLVNQLHTTGRSSSQRPEHYTD
jgi:hypothetical protein